MNSAEFGIRYAGQFAWFLTCEIPLHYIVAFIDLDLIANVANDG